MTSHSLDVPLDPIRQEEIDLLVEGELSPPERDELVARFDRDGNGWRRCALAFMERDALRRITCSDSSPLGARVGIEFDRHAGDGKQ